MVELQSTLETRFGVETRRCVWQQVRTVGDLRGLLLRVNPERWLLRAARHRAHRSDSAGSASSRPPARDDTIYPRWPWWPLVRWLRIGFLECVLVPLIWLLLGPRIGPPSSLPGPHCSIANHVTAFDVP